jgi:hypothetical protein
VAALAGLSRWAARLGVSTWVALAALALLVPTWVGDVSMAMAMGWDESMHAQLPALRLLHFARVGDPLGWLRALTDCEQYPFGWGLVLFFVQLVSGPSEAAARAAGRVCWIAGLLALFLCARSMAASAAPARPPAGRAALWTLALAACSPLALAFSGSLYLEVPFTALMALSLWAWIERARRPCLGWQVFAGALAAGTFFVKFNYGLLFGVGLLADLLCAGLTELRARRGRRWLVQCACLAAVPLVSFGWWFLWPWPLERAVGASHRAALGSFLSGNLDPSMRTPWSLRGVHWTCFLFWSPRVLLLAAAGLLASARFALAPSVRAMWISLLALGLPIALHPFHLDRFLIPLLVPLALLSGLGLAWLLPAGRLPHLAAAGLLALLTASFPGRDGWWLMQRIAPGDPKLDDYRRGVLTSLQDLRGRREVKTAGLPRATAEHLIDLLGAELQPSDRVGWVGNSNVFSPCVLFGGLWERGGEPHRELAEGHFEADMITIGNDDPRWSTERLLVWARGHSLLFTTHPADMTRNAGRTWLERYNQDLQASGQWSFEELGQVELARPGGSSVSARVFALRPAS